MKLYVVIVTYNGEQWLSTSLKSLKNSALKPHIIVVDNASADGTCAYIEQNFSKIKLIKNTSNLGFGKANNIGISYAMKAGADYVFLLNQDAFIRQDTLEVLVNASMSNSEYGILSPIHLNWKGDELEHYFSQFGLKNNHFYSDAILKSTYRSIYEVPFVNAAGWLLTKKVLLTIGGFDPMFQHYGEDNNYCQRALYHGLKIGIVPNSYICHDSKKRLNTNPDYLFSDDYYRDEANALQLNLGNINKAIDKADYKKIEQHVAKLVLINLLRLNFSSVRGYLKKIKIYRDSFQAIKKSRELTRAAGPHYLKL